MDCVIAYNELKTELFRQCMEKEHRDGWLIADQSTDGFIQVLRMRRFGMDSLDYGQVRKFDQDKTEFEWKF